MDTDGKIKVVLLGAYGKTGYEVVKMIDNERGDCFELVATVDKRDEAQFKELSEYDGEADVIIDFSHHSITNKITEYATRKNVPLVIATTAHTDEELQMLHKAAETLPVFIAANLSVAVVLLTETAKRFARLYEGSDVEIIEKHHNRKPDAPSGTALMMANEIKDVRPDAEFVFGRSGEREKKRNEIGIHSIRLSNSISDHEIIIANESQTITLGHQVFDSKIYADGALSAAAYIVKQSPGIYGMAELLSNY